MLLCKGHELKEESGFNPTQWGDFLSARILGCWILLFTMATNCANLLRTDLRLQSHAAKTLTNDKSHRAEKRAERGVMDLWIKDGLS